MSELNIYYPNPMQVRYKRPGILGERIGIVCEEFLIDIEDGMKFSIKSILAQCENPDDAILEWCDWVPLDFVKIY